MTRKRSDRDHRPAKHRPSTCPVERQDPPKSSSILPPDAGAESPFRSVEFHVAWAVTFLLALAAYWLTLAPGLTGGDSGELISAAWLLGIPHPPGYPLWTMIAHLFARLPWGSAAYNINFMSAFFGAATAALVAVVTFSLVRNAAVAVCAGLCLAFSDMFWSQSVIAKGLYALNTFLVMLIVWLLILWQRSRKPSFLLASSLLYGLGCANHPTAWPLGVIFAGFVLFTDRKALFGKLWVLPSCIGLFLLGLSVYLYLPIRAAADTYMNWGNPRTFDDMLFHVLRKQYPSGGADNPRSLGLFIRQSGRLVEFMLHQFTPALIGLVAAGFIAHLRRREWGRFLLFGAIFAATSVGFVVTTNFKIELQEIMVNSVFFVSAMPVAAVWLGLGVHELVSVASAIPAVSARLSPRRARWIAALVIPLVPFLAFYGANDKSKYFYAQDYGLNILETLDRSAIFFPSGDHSSFTVMYLQAVEGRRLDVTVADKYGYIEKNLYAPVAAKYPRFPDKQDRAEIERWIIEHTDRPVYFTTKRDMGDLPGYRIAPVGILYRVFRPKEEVALHPELWASYRWRNLEGVPSSRDYTANVILSDLHYFKGLLALEQDRPNAAIEEFRQVVASAQDMKEVYNNLGSACAEKGLLTVAAYFYERAIEISPRYLTARRNLAFICKDLGRTEDAVKHFRAASELAPNNLTYPMELAALLEQTGQPEEALQIFTRLSRADPKNYFFFRHLGFLYRDLRKDKAAAVTNLRKSLDLNPDQPDVRAALSQLEE